MRIARVQIFGYRGIAKADITLPTHAVIVGANNVGKTAITEAIALLFGRGHLVRALNDYDYFGGMPTAASRIGIRAVVTDFPTEDSADYPGIFSMKRGAPAWWSEDRGELLHAPNGEAKLAVELALAARFDEETLESQVVRYFVDGDTDPFVDEAPRNVPDSFRHMFGLYLLPATRTWEQLLTFNSSLFRKLLQYSAATPAAAVLGLRESLRRPSHRPEEDQPLAQIVQRINSELCGYVGEGEADLQFRPTSGDVPAILASLTAFLRGKTGDHVPMSAGGSGVRSLQTLLLLLEFGRARSLNGENFVLVAEEPELHLHPGHHRRLVARMRGVSQQTIITTHSPQVAAYHTPAEIVVAQSESGALTAKPLLGAKENIPARNSLLRLYTVYRAEVCEALMHRVAVLPEGMTEFWWLRTLARESITAEAWSGVTATPAMVDIGVLPTQSAEVCGTYQQFARVVSSVVPMVDGDTEGKRYAAELCVLNAPPPAVVRLPDGMTIEGVIARFVCGTSMAVPNDVAQLLSLPAPSTVDQLTAALGETAKTRWDIHEKIGALVGLNAEATERVRVFFEAIRHVADGGDNPIGMTRDPTLSTGATVVWVWEG